jgi:predicted phage terminase large subunit-like protein
VPPSHHITQRALELAKLERQLARTELAIAQQEIRALATQSFLSFVRFMHPEWKLAWFHYELIELLQAVQKKQLHFLIVTMPPGCAKSSYASELFPAYLFGCNPNQQLIGVSHTAGLATKVNRNIQAIITSEKYTMVYPDTRIPEDGASGAKLRNQDIFETVGANGHYVSAGILGGAVGRRGDVIIDDPIKLAEHAQSPTHRDKLDNEYKTSLKTRPHPDGFKIIIATRWHTDDLVGRRISEGAIAGVEQPRLFSVPAIKIDPPSKEDPREPGDPIWPESGRDKAWAAQVRASDGEATWAALYQQNPANPGAGTIKTFNIGFWYPPNVAEPPPYKMIGAEGEQITAKQKPLPELARQIQSWDLTFKDTSTSDFVAGQVWGYMASDEVHEVNGVLKPVGKPVNAYLLGRFWKRADFVATCEAVLQLTKEFPKAGKKLVEDKANGAAVMSQLKLKVPGFEAVNPKGGKVSRAVAITPYVDGGNVWMPHPALFPWVKDFLKEISDFPRGKNDDMVDAATQALSYIFDPPKFRLY